MDDRKHHVADSQILDTHRCCVVSAVQSRSVKEFHEKKIADMRLSWSKRAVVVGLDLQKKGYRGFLIKLKMSPLQNVNWCFKVNEGYARDLPWHRVKYRPLVNQ